jgi:hypothetical protein
MDHEAGAGLGGNFLTGQAEVQESEALGTLETHR